MVKAMWISGVALMAAVLLVTVAKIPVAEAVTCLPSELAPCAEAMTSSFSQPSGLCCGKLREQKPCLCEYMNNPSLRQFVSSPNAMKVSHICKINFPSC